MLLSSDARAAAALSEWMMMNRTTLRTAFACLSLLSTTAHPASAAIHSETVLYKQGDTPLEGFVAWDDASTGKRPGILVVHEWDGLGSYVKKRCEQLAGLGYVAFAADIYGKGVRPKTPQECGAEAAKYKTDLPLFLARLNAGLNELKQRNDVDPSRIAAIGYCFGGTAVLELARSGADIAGVVSFHGGLASQKPAGRGVIKCKVLVLTGANDPNAKPEAVDTFEGEMRTAGADWSLTSYGNAVHGFTNPARGTDTSKGLAYDEKADKRSWQAMKDFFAELFARPS